MVSANPRQLAALVQEQQAAEAEHLEQQTAAIAEGDAGTELAAVVAAALTGWVTAFGSLGAAGAGTALAAYLLRVRKDADRATAGLGRRAARTLEGALVDAVRMGGRHAAGFAHTAGAGVPRLPDARVTRGMLTAARAVADTVAEQLRLARALLAPGRVLESGWHGVILGLAAARRAVTLVRAQVAWSIHQAINNGARQAIITLGARTLWVSEPTACVRCAAYAGRTADADGLFPGGLSFDPNQRDVRSARIDGPPAHINCRCRLVPWRDEWAGPGPGLPELLREQAWRSVASGGARPSESRAARLRAARSLAALPHVPPQLRRQARTAVAAGHF